MQSGRNLVFGSGESCSKHIQVVAAAQEGAACSQGFWHALLRLHDRQSTSELHLRLSDVYKDVLLILHQVACRLLAFAAFVMRDLAMELPA